MHGGSKPPRWEWCTISRRSVAIAVVLSAAVMAVLQIGPGVVRCRAAGEFVLGPPENVAVVETFTADKQKLWRFSSGGNVKGKITAGAELPGVAKSLLKLDAVRRKAAITDGAQNWVSIERRDLPPGAIPSESEGLHFLVASQSSAQWWMSFTAVLANGESYSGGVTNEVFPTSQFVEVSVRLQDLKAGDKALRPDQYGSIKRLGIATSSPGTPLYLGDITAYRVQKSYSWLDFATSHPGNSLFEPKDAVALDFTLGGARPKAAKGFRYEVRDFAGEVTACGVVKLTSADSYSVEATPKTHGYYEVSAFFTDAAGKDLEKRSCLRAEGSVPIGLGTFAVLPSSVPQNIEAFKRQGQAAFFGLHGDFLGLADAIGLTWRFGYLKWAWLEQTQPDRSGGELARWASDLMDAGPEPAYRQHILPFRGNSSEEVPSWAARAGGGTPAFADWADYLAMVRDYVRAEKALYPHMKPRIYGSAWEVNLNMPPYSSQSPAYTPEQAVELIRRTSQVVKAEDPDGIVIGPCPNVLDMAWYESMFKAGALQYLDAIETHSYCDGVFTPEENDFPAKIAKLNELMRQYNNGKVLPIYCTEGGFPGAVSKEQVYRSQAQRMVREAIILKGEGVRAFLPFYGIDYDRSQFGFMFNLELEPNPWATTRVSPKPTVNAFAACAQLLEGAVPVGRIRDLGDGVWAYAFEKLGSGTSASTATTAVWTTGPPRTVLLPLGSTAGADVGAVTVVDIMGHSSKRSVVGGQVALEVDESPQYVVVERAGR